MFVRPEALTTAKRIATYERAMVGVLQFGASTVETADSSLSMWAEGASVD